jgi:DNA-directed RNA polymerase subunit RPC12/RpoP
VSEPEKHIDHRFTVHIVCPYCGYKHDDTDWVIDNHMEGEHNCAECKKRFKFNADIEITWITERMDDDD